MAPLRAPNAISPAPKTGPGAMDDLIYLLGGLAVVGLFALYAVALRRI
jgi:LPXTG-motif cell wall-anchored protein